MGLIGLMFDKCQAYMPRISISFSIMAFGLSDFLNFWQSFMVAIARAWPNIRLSFRCDRPCLFAVEHIKISPL